MGRLAPRAPSTKATGFGLLFAGAAAVAGWAMLFVMAIRLVHAVKRHPDDILLLGCSGMLLAAAAVVSRPIGTDRARIAFRWIGLIVGLGAITMAVRLWTL